MTTITTTITTHVLDTGRGRPAAGVPVRLMHGDVVLAEATTDADGRARDLSATAVGSGVYQLAFDIAAYDAEAFFPEVVVTFVVRDDRHHHVPLLLSPFAYSTYRGS
jgi:5-hydroxyisourate hydrolase